ncbi:MAG: ELM1/GtrOC1 family putative glycosyltransferase [Geminicoccaceae bacterium]
MTSELVASKISRADTLSPSVLTCIWVLLGARFGDNQQMLALAEASGVAYEVKQLPFNWKSGLPNILLGPSLASVETGTNARLSTPWPDAVISSGRRAVPVAKWIRKQSGERTKLIHVGRPWAPLAWFDLIITTPQYGLPAGNNVQCNLMPLATGQETTEALSLPTCVADEIEAVPKPWITVVLGGNSRPYVFTEAAAVELATIADDQARQFGGGLIVLAGPRTPSKIIDTLRSHLSTPAFFHSWNAKTSPYPMMRQRADRFIVTGDSVAVIADSAASGRPTTVFDLPMRPDLRTRVTNGAKAMATRHLIAKHAFDRLVDWGLISSLRDLGAYRQALEAEGLLEGSPAAGKRRAGELDQAAERIRGLLNVPSRPCRPETATDCDRHGLGKGQFQRVGGGSA